LAAERQHAARVEGVSKPEPQPRPEGCPPPEATPLDGDFYRLVRKSLQIGQEVPADEWVPPYQKRRSECTGQPERCECHAHSIFANIDDLLRARDLVPWVRSKAIGRVQLVADHGVGLKSDSLLGPSHYDWWPHNENVVPQGEVVEAAA
jgi:hypothetical protein